jgi:L-alanine-DL-glutamate epimerase-like enolase superfamily enzyme
MHCCGGGHPYPHPISIPRWPPTSCGFSETAHWLEWQDWTNPILQQPYEVKDGKLHVPDVPGADWNGMRRQSPAYLADKF